MTLREQVTDAVAQDEWLIERMNGVQVQTSVRIQLMGGLFYQVQENATSVRVLLSQTPQPLYGSAAALARPIFEMFVRGLWVRHCAADAQIENLSQRDDFNDWGRSMATMTADADAAAGFNGWLLQVQQRYWTAFCSYAHGGLRLIARRNSEHGIKCMATEEESIALLRFALLMTLFVTSIWCELGGDQEGAQEASKRARVYLT